MVSSIWFVIIVSRKGIIGVEFRPPSWTRSPTNQIDSAEYEWENTKNAHLFVDGAINLRHLAELLSRFAQVHGRLPSIGKLF